MKERLITRLSVLLVASLLLLSQSASAGVTGKISGLVKEAQGGRPLIGATVRVVGTDLVAQTDEDGEYFIIGIPSGKYDISVTHVGFENLIKKDVRVLLDLTTPVDFSLQVAVIELKNQMVVYASAPPVQKDLTESKVIFTSDRLKNLPNQQSVQTVLQSYPGVVMDRNNAMHVRGGRTGQIAYYYNGFSIQDPFNATSGMRIIPGALEELSLTSGGYTAEYGEALSGVVSAVTPEGGSTYHGKVRTFEGFTHVYDVNTGTWGDLNRNGNRSVSASLSGPVPFADPTRYTFFASGEYLKDNSSLPHNTGITGGGVGKVTMRPMNRLKMAVNYAFQNAHGDNYVHRDGNGVSYDFNLDGLPSFRNRAYLIGASANYTTTERSILSFSMSRYRTQTYTAPKKYFDVYWSDWSGYHEDSTGAYNGTIQVGNYLNNRDATNAYQMTGFTVGDDYEPLYGWRRTIYNSISGSWLSQLTKTNEVKVGMTYRYYDIAWDSKQFFNVRPYGERYISKPKYASMYAQDKLEYRDIVLNLGVRLDYRNTDISYNAMPESTAAIHWQRADSRTEISPRLGVSFPVSENSVMRFNYGVYYQAPQFSYLYMDLQGDITSGRPLLGNPDMKSEQTKAYELGLTQMINDGLRLSLTAYFKDMKDLVTTRRYTGTMDETQARLARISRFENSDYGSAKGFDIMIEKLPESKYFSGSISYSYLIANGIGSYSTEPYYTYLGSTTDSLAPVKEYPLDFDQRHTLTLTADVRLPSKWHGSLFGMGIPGGWGLNMVGHIGSGLPYTKTDSKGNRIGERNEGRLPSNTRVDLRFNKDFATRLKNTTVTFFVEVDNLFNKHNVLNVYSRTGLPDSDGQVVGSAGLSTSADEISRLDRLYDHDPQNYSLPRTVRTGLEIGF